MADGAAIKVTGTKSLLGKLGRITRVATAGRLMYRAMYGPAQAIMENAKNRCPVDTGNLRDSIHIIVAANRGRTGISQSAEDVGSGNPTGYKNTEERLRIEALARYAINVEYGTRKMPAMPFLRPAVDEEKAQFVRDVTVFALEIIVGIWTTPIGGFVLSFPIEDIGDKAKEAYVNRREIAAKLTGKEPPKHIKVRRSLRGALANELLAKEMGARSLRASKAALYTERRLARARRRGGNG